MLILFYIFLEWCFNDKYLLLFRSFEMEFESGFMYFGVLGLRGSIFSRFTYLFIFFCGVLYFEKGIRIFGGIVIIYRVKYISKFAFVISCF